METPVKVKVVFRKDNEGTVFALFPYEAADDEGHCTCFQHVGQHSAADYDGCIGESVPAKPEEYAPLKRELEGRGYEITVISRRSRAIIPRQN